MLGNDASFAYIHAVNLSQSKNFSTKRIGYLASSLFLGPEDPLLLMLVATLQRDLASKNDQEVTVALNTVCKILCQFIVMAIVESVTKLLNHNNDTIRKKACMALHKIVKVSPTSVLELNDKMKRALCDKDPSVMAASLNLFFDAIKLNPSKYKDLTSSFVVILKQVMEHKLARDYDYHRIPAPWIQIKLLQILAMLGANDQKTSAQIYEIISMTMKRVDDTGINIGFAITYQCVKTIAIIYPNAYLLGAATSSLARFLSPENQYNNNLKFLGINALIYLVSINPKYALEHQLVVVDCLESRDETLKRETLDLLYKMTNTSNVKAISEKLLLHLKSTSDAHFKKELVFKITSLAERFTPSQEWYINIMNKEQGEYISILSEKLLTILDNTFDDENTKAWIITALSKLAAIPNNTKKEEIEEQFTKYSNSKYLDIQHRSSEYKLLSKYGSSTEIGIDISLSFLDKFVEKAKKSGARSYDKNRLWIIPGIRDNTGENPSTTTELKVAYTQSDMNKNKAGESSDQVGIKIQGKEKWTSKGYKVEQFESNINKFPQSFSPQQTESISSNDLKQGKIFPGYDKVTSPSFSSSSTTTFGNTAKEDAKIQQKQAYANELLFGSSSTTTTTQPTKRQQTHLELKLQPQLSQQKQ